MADHTPSDLERNIRRSFSELFEKDKRIEAIYKKIRQGRATYADASLFAEEVGTILAKVYKGIDFATVDVNDLAENIVVNSLNQNIALTDLVCESVQSSLNEAAGVGMNPVKPYHDPSRVNGIKTLVEEAEDAEEIAIALNEPVITNAISNVDNWVKTNADFQYDAGMQPRIVRTWSGSYPSHDTKHTDWCEDLAGEWNYGEQPSDVFRRHEGCRCTVEYFPSKKAQGRITAMAKGEKDTEGVMERTGKFTSTKRRAILEQRRKIYGKEEARRILNEEWKGGLNGNAERHFT